MRIPWVMAITSVVLWACDASAQTLRSDFWAPNGAVSGAVVLGNTLYFHGGFNYLGPQTGAGVLLSEATAAAAVDFPRVHGSVLAVIPDGAGGWFIGGAIGSVGGQPRSGVAHVLADLSVAQWSPSIDGHVRGLALRGSTLYAGGLFTTVNGQARSGLVALDAASGVVTSWDPGVAGGVVNSLALSGDGARCMLQERSTSSPGNPAIGSVRWVPHPAR